MIPDSSHMAMAMICICFKGNTGVGIKASGSKKYDRREHLAIKSPIKQPL